MSRLGPRTRSWTAANVVSLDAPSSAAQSAARRIVVSSVSSVQNPADQQDEAQREAGEGKEEAVEVGRANGGVVQSTDSTGLNLVSDLGSEAPNTGCTVATGTHCCQCHLRPGHAVRGYGSCIRSTGAPYPDCECGGQCGSGQCAQWECVGHMRNVPASSSGSLSSVRRRSVASPARLMEEQEGLEAERQIRAHRRREEADGAAPALAQDAAGAPPQVMVGAAHDTQLPPVAAIASHKHLHDTVPYALQPLWQQLCEPEFERYRQACSNNDADGTAAALVSILQLPGKHLYKQRVPKNVRRMLRREHYRDNDWQLQRLRTQLRDVAIPAGAAAVGRQPASGAVNQPVLGAAELERKYDDSDNHDQYGDISDDCTVVDAQAVLHAKRLIGAAISMWHPALSLPCTAHSTAAILQWMHNCVHCTHQHQQLTFRHCRTTQQHR